MEGMSKRISKVIRNMQSFGVQQMIVGGSGYAEPLQERQREVRHTFPSDNESHLVGLEQNVKKLVGYLVEEESTQVVSVIGMGGIGKTTLARQVFNHETINTHFDGVAWVCVSQQFTRKSVWQTILVKLISKDEEHGVSNMIEDQLQEKLFRMLETRKCLIALDDIWKEEDWDRIKPIFPPTKGWKILLTSRNEGVALRADPKCFTLKPDCLNPEESWALFRRIVFPRTTDYKGDEEREEMGKEMIKHCSGLPLAVKLLGGLLAQKNTLDEWTKVYKNIKPQIIGRTSFKERNMRSVYHILYLSYEELPVYLKQCFLYLSHFPEDREIEVEKLSYYWAAEGVPRLRCFEGESIRDIGDGYIEELVKRNMIIAERDDKTSRFESCSLHDMMRELCLHKAEEENFVQIVDACSTMTSTANSQLPCKPRRLAIQSSDHTFPIENPKLRSLLLLEPLYCEGLELRFTRLQLMRVLDLSFAEFDGGKVPSSIGKLIHLRYLSLFWANVTHLPSSMRNLKQLIYLNLDVLGKLYMPNILKEMRELTYLEFSERLHDKVKLEVGNLVNLETLVNFSTEYGDVRDLQGMTRLETLSILFSRRCSVETLSSSLSELKHLKYLTIDDSEEQICFDSDEEEFVLDCKNLRELDLRIYMPRLPDEPRFTSRLTTISLANCRLEEDPMPILEKLDQLKEVKLSVHSFSGSIMVCSSGGFPQLQKLELYGLKEWEEWIVEEGSMPLLRTLQINYCWKLEEWIVEEGAMPLLRTLEIYDCKKLKELRDRLRFITSLKDVHVRLRGEEWKNRFSEEHLPSRLTSIHLDECHLKEDPMPILEKLLHLKEVTLWSESFRGKRIVCSRGGFPQLQKLEFYKLYEWEEWIVEEGSMPFLHTLKISTCKKLKELPDGLRFITSLKYMECRELGDKWKRNLSEGGEDYYKIQHIPSVVTFDKEIETFQKGPLNKISVCF